MFPDSCNCKYTFFTVGHDKPLYVSSIDLSDDSDLRIASRTAKSVPLSSSKPFIRVSPSI